MAPQAKPWKGVNSEERKPDLIIGVDFGMTYTGEISHDNRRQIY